MISNVRLVQENAQQTRGHPPQTLATQVSTWLLRIQTLVLGVNVRRARGLVNARSVDDDRLVVAVVAMPLLFTDNDFVSSVLK